DKVETERGVFPQELEAIPMFMKRCPAEIDAARQPDLACLQSLLFDEDCARCRPAELAKMYKNEGNEYFREKDYGRAVVSYSEGLKKKCEDAELNAVLHTNRGAAHFHLGNYRSALNDAIQAKKLKPTHLKAIIRGALCHMELKNFSEAIAWCEEGLRIDSKEKKLVEMRAKADKLKRAAERDARKAKVIEKKEQGQKETLLAAIKLYFEDEERAEMYELNPDQTLLQALQHQRYFVKAGTPTVLAFVKRSPFSKKYFTGRKVHRLRR
uniref:Tetratricopeptide repeat domain 4 n=1 Tax=Anas platyrhynchos platyrhynchos TaxID=8840 RepID=A0A493TDX0_ANAPP